MEPRGSGAVEGLPRLPERLALGALVVAGVLTSFHLQWVVRTERGLPLWDEAAQSLVGAQMLDALRGLHPFAFLALVNRQVVWPPVHGLMLAPWMAGSGNDWESAARFSAFLIALLPLALFAAGSRLNATRGTWVGLGAATFVLVAPRYQIFGTLGMLEVPGALLLATTVALHAAAIAGGDRRSAWVAAGLSTTALFLLKYNYGTLWLAALLLFEAWELPATRRAVLVARVKAWFTRGRWLRPMPLIAALYALALIAIVVTGGASFDVFGRSVSVHSAGNPAYGLFVFLCVWFAVDVMRHRDHWRTRWRALSVRRRVLLTTIAAPLALWFLMPWPNRVRAFVEFSLNRSSGPPPWTLEGLLFYPRALVNEYAPFTTAGILLLALALVPPRRNESAALRLTWLAGIVGLIATMAHRYHDVRFLFTTLVPLALAASARAVAWFDTGLASRAPRIAWAAWTALLVGFAAVPLVVSPRDAAVRIGHRAYRCPEALAPALDDVVRQSADTRRPPVLLGWCEAVSPALLAWRARVVLPAHAGYAPPRRLAWLPEGAPPAAIEARVVPLLARPGVVLALTFAPTSPIYAYLRSEVWADSVTAEQLARDHRVTRERDATLTESEFACVLPRENARR